MNTIDDLRGLAAHADGLPDTERHARPGAVRARIRTVRRRRTAMAGAVAALVLVGAVAGATALRLPAPVPPAAEVAGVAVPDSLTVTGFPYRLRDTVDLEGGEHYQVEQADHGQAVTLVGTGLGPGSATLLRDGEPVVRVRGGEAVSYALPLDEGTPELTVRLDGTLPGAETGLALYEATGVLAPGVSNGTAVFRETLAGNPLLGAAFAEPGESSVEFTVAGAETMRFVPWCDAKDETLWVHIDVDGEPGIATSCGSVGPDAATGSSGTFPRMVEAESHDVRVYLTRDGSDEPVEVDGVRVGGAAYAQTYSGDRVMGVDVSETVEFDGRTWVLDRVWGPRSPGDQSVEIDAIDGDVLLGSASRGQRVALAWTGRLDAGSFDRADSDSTITGLGGLLLAGDTYRVGVTGAPGDVAALLVYRRL